MDINEELEWVCRPLGTAPLPIEEFYSCMDALITEAEAIPGEEEADVEPGAQPQAKKPGLWDKMKGKLQAAGEQARTRLQPDAVDKFEAIKQWLANAFQHYPKAREHLRKVNAVINAKYYADPKGLMATLQKWADGVMVPSLEKRVTDMSLEAKTAKQLADHLKKLLGFGLKTGYAQTRTDKMTSDDSRSGVVRDKSGPAVEPGTPKGKGAYGGNAFTQERRKPAF